MNIVGLLELGYKNELNSPPQLMKDLVKDLKVLPTLEGSLRFLFLELEKDGYFIRDGINKDHPDLVTFKLKTILPSGALLDGEISRLYPLAHELSPSEVILF
jgi:hypothetical protein